MARTIDFEAETIVRATGTIVFSVRTIVPALRAIDGAAAVTIAVTIATRIVPKCRFRDLIGSSPFIEWLS